MPGTSGALQNSMTNWTTTYFGQLYHEIYSGYVLDDERSAAEAAFASDILGLGNRTVLDLASGFGRHTRWLAHANRVYALELNPKYIEAMTESLPERLAKKVTPLCADMRSIPLEDASVDAAILLFNSFGYFDTDGAQSGDNRRVLSEVFRVLKPGGGFLLELPNPRALLEAVEENPRRVVLVGDYEIHEEFEWDAAASVLGNRTRFVGPESEEEAEYRLRLYSPAEIKALLEETGFRVRRQYGSYDGDRFRPVASDSLILHAVKPSR